MLNEHNYASRVNCRKINILGLNVCGLLSKLELGIIDNYVQDYDFLCFSETKTNDIDVNDINGFTPFILQPKTKDQKLGGFHGICIFVRNNIADFFHVITDSVSKSILWLKVDEDAYGSELLIGSVYFPHEGSWYYDSNIFDDLAEDVLTLNSQGDLPTLLIGDFNARTGCLDDFVCMDDSVALQCGTDLSDDDLFNTKHELDSLGIETSRFSQDGVVNNSGRMLVELCRSLDLKFMNGKFGSDYKIGEYTCSSSSGKSVVDYAIGSPGLLTRVSDFAVENFDACLSDVHMPICVQLQLDKSPVNQTKAHDQSSDSDCLLKNQCVRSKWNPDCKVEFCNALSNVDMQPFYQQLSQIEREGATQNNVNELASRLCGMFIGAGTSVGLTKEIKTSKRVHAPKLNSKPWFDAQCESEQREYFDMKNRLNKQKTVEAANQLRARAREYKKFIRRTRRIYGRMRLVAFAM